MIDESCPFISQMKCGNKWVFTIFGESHSIWAGEWLKHQQTMSNAQLDGSYHHGNPK